MNRNKEQYKRMVKFIFSVIVLSLEMAVFWYIWISFYNQKMETPYNRSGHWLMVAVYGIFLMLFNTLYGGLKVGYLRTGNMIYSQFLAAVCANLMAYLQITLLTKSFQDILEGFCQQRNLEIRHQISADSGKKLGINHIPRPQVSHL